MKENLEQEVIQLAKKIINNPLFLKHSGLLLQEIRNIYEKLTILNFLEKNIKDQEKLKNLSSDIEKIYPPIENKSTQNIEKQEDIQKDEENILSDKITENFEPESTPKHTEEIKNTPFLEDILAQVAQDLVFEQKTSINEQIKEAPKTLNDKIIANQNIQIGLNDKLAFIKHLFNGETEDYTKALLVLNQYPTEKECIQFIQQKIKPNFNNWQGKEEYEERFISIISKKFN
ncbi:MAG: hypothetical protein Q3983_03615 [Capnocytophaga sp.]|nr:hypothetical protein [Capnocytophaga sp.]